MRLINSRIVSQRTWNRIPVNKIDFFLQIESNRRGCVSIYSRETKTQRKETTEWDY